MHMLQSLFYLTTAVHVSGITIAHLQEHKTTVTTASGNRYTVIDRVKFTDNEYRQTGLKLQQHENINRSTRHPQNTPISSNSSTIAADNSTVTCIIHYSIELIEFPAEYTLSTTIVIYSSLPVLFISKFNSIYYSVTVTRCCSYSCFVLLKMGDSDARNMQSRCQIK